MNKVIALICATALLLFAFVPFNVEASDNILRIVQGYTQSSLAYEYNKLNSDQKDICNFLIGCYNATYLGSRGFEFAPGQITDFSSLELGLRVIGSKIMDMTTIATWGSRMSDVFCNYISSCILYAKSLNVSLYDWWTNLPNDFSIPYGKDIYDAWNNFYNDISNDGIISFQISESPWVSGVYYSNELGSYNWTSSAQSQLNSFMTNYSPILFTNLYRLNSGSYYYLKQYPISLSAYPDSLYIQRNSGNTSYRYYKFGFQDTSINSVIMNRLSIEYSSRFNTVEYAGAGYDIPVNFGVVNAGTDLDLSSIVSLAFNRTPLYNSGLSEFSGYYPLIQHVYLVDNLSNYSNKVEIFNTDGVELTGGDSVAYIPKEDMLFYIKQLETDLPFPYPASEPVPVRNIVVNNTYNYYGEQADPSTDFETAVIDRSAQSFSEPYSVDEGIFTQASEYISYLWENTKPLILYTKDLLECFTITPTETDEETDGSTGLALAIYGSLAVGVAGGLISKLLL